MTNRAFAAEYLAARKDARSADDLAGRGKAEAKARRIASAADRAGVRIDEISLDEQARRELFPTPAPKPRIVGYSVVGLPIYG